MILQNQVDILKKHLRIDHVDELLGNVDALDLGALDGVEPEARTRACEILDDLEHHCLDARQLMLKQKRNLR